MFQNENIVARWQFSQEFWKQMCNEDMVDSGIGKIVGFFLGGIFALLYIVPDLPLSLLYLFPIIS